MKYKVRKYRRIKYGFKHFNWLKNRQITQRTWYDPRTTRRKLDISIKHCSSVERGLSSLSLEKLIDVSYLFDVSLDYLIKGNSASNDSIKQIWANLPRSITSVLTSENEEEIQLLVEYMQLYSKLRKSTKK